MAIITELPIQKIAAKYNYMKINLH